jgi:hypothetical protein
MINKKESQKNVLGENLEPCSNDPLTGWLRDGCCNTDKFDRGIHTVCAKVTDKFLIWSKDAGNDLISPHPEFNFPGLKDGDSWCVCAATYAQSIEAGTACKIFLKKTNYKTLEIVSLEKLKQYAIDLS